MKVLLTILFCFLCHTAAYSQAFVKIAGSRFRVDLNERDRTAAIVDYLHEIDDSEFPLSLDKRKLKDLGRKNRRLVIPDTVRVDGRDFTVVAIGRAAFADYSNFYFVEIPETVVSIGDYAFLLT